MPWKECSVMDERLQFVAELYRNPLVCFDHVGCPMSLTVLKGERTLKRHTGAPELFSLIRILWEIAPLVRAKRRRRESLCIEKIALRAVGPSVADSYGGDNLGTGNHDRVTVDQRRSPVEFPVLSGDGKCAQSAATFGR